MGPEGLLKKRCMKYRVDSMWWYSWLFSLNWGVQNSAHWIIHSHTLLMFSNHEVQQSVVILSVLLVVVLVIFPWNHALWINVYHIQMWSSSLLCFDIFDVLVSWSRINPLKNNFFLSVVSVKLLKNMIRRGTKAHKETEGERWKPPMWNFKKTNSHSKRVNESFSENSVFDGQFCDWYRACFSHNYSLTWLIWLREGTMFENKDNDRFRTLFMFEHNK